MQMFNYYFRLQAYDRNQDFCNEPILMPDPLEPNWPTHGFQQINMMHRLLMPKLTREQVTGYFIYRLAGDQETSNDIKALSKGENMVETRVLACSFQQNSEHIFLSGIVGAAMKTKVHVYKSNLNFYLYSNELVSIYVKFNGIYETLMLLFIPKGDI